MDDNKSFADNNNQQADQQKQEAEQRQESQNDTNVLASIITGLNAKLDKILKAMQCDGDYKQDKPQAETEKDPDNYKE